MKSTYLFILILFIAYPGICTAQEIVYDQPGNRHGLSLGYSGPDRVDLDFSMNRFEIAQGTFAGHIMQELKTPGVILFNEQGAPDLPSFSARIAIPEGSTPVLTIHDFETDTLFGLDIRPAPVIPSDNDTGDLVYLKNESIYNTDAWYPSEFAALSKAGEIRGTGFIVLGINPFLYNPVTGTLVVFKNMSITVEFQGGNGIFGDERLRSVWWEPILQDAFINSSSLLPLKIGQNPKSGLTGYDYLIITLNKPEFLAWADSLKRFRTAQGILTGVVTIDEACGNDTWLIDRYIEDIYAGWDIPPSAVLLLADYGNGEDGITSSHLIHEVSGSLISDNVFADVNGDYLPDIAFARIAAENADHLERMISKILDYERTPPVNPGFYDHPVTALGWETARWFQLCSEVINGFWEYGLGKQPVRENCIFWGTPGGVWSTAPNTDMVVNYFGPNGLGYIPDNSAHLTDWGGNAARINNDINNGAFMVQHRDHGLVSGWGEPYYRSFHIPGLYNDDPTFVFSVNCLTGQFNSTTDCFQEVFQRHMWGALGVIAATEESFSFVNDTYVWGMYDYMWPGFMPDYGSNPESRGVLPCFANVAGKYFLQQSAWPYNTAQKTITYNLFHHHGDAFMTVYTEVPQNLSVEHDSILVCNGGGLYITADTNSFISVNCGQIILATEWGAGIQQFIPLAGLEPGMKLHITITKQNYFRYSSQIEVVAPDGPYVLAPEYSFDESTGHYNNIAEVGESLQLNLVIKNYGDQPALNTVVTLSSSSPFITLEDTVENFGNLAAGQVKAIDHGFSLTIHDDLTTATEVLLQFNITDGTNSWISEKILNIRVPVPVFRGYTILDQFTDNNQQLSPGETAQIGIRLVNNGDGPAWTINASAVSAGSYIEILTPVVIIDSIMDGQSALAEFVVVTNPVTPEGTQEDIIVTVACKNVIIQDTFHLNIGRYTENWESSTMDMLPWMSTGDAAWYVTTLDRNEGLYSARSGFIIDEQSTTLQLDYIVASDDSISFFCNVSSELNWDYFEFYIDDIMMDEWSGETGWIKATFPVSAGPHAFRWVYVKDLYLSTGRDCAFLDMISLPECPLVFAGRDTLVCENISMPVKGLIRHCLSPLWTSSGDGFFDDPANLTTAYHPGNNDISAGEVSLILTAVTEFGSISDSLYVMITGLPSDPGNISGPDTLCQGSGPVLYWVPSVPGASVYEWAVIPADAGNPGNGSTQCLIDWYPSFSGDAMITLKVYNFCGIAEDSSTRMVYLGPLPITELDLPDMVQVTDPPFELTGGTPGGGIYSGPGVYNNYFYPNVAGPGVHLIDYTYSDSLGCVNSEQDSITVDAGTGIDYPLHNEPFISPNPFSDYFDIYLPESPEHGLNIRVKTISGNMVISRDFLPDINRNSRRVNASQLPPGIYIVELQISSAIRTFKVVKLY